MNGIKKIDYKLRKRGLIPKLHIMDNVSEDLKQYFEESDIRFQLIPPRMHWRNSAKRSLLTLNNHFIYYLCTVEHTPSTPPLLMVTPLTPSQHDTKHVAVIPTQP